MTAELGATTERILNRMAYAIANKATDVGTVATDDRLLVADTSADGALKYATPAQIMALRSVVSVADATTYLVLAADSGKTHILPDFTATCTITFPTAAAGLEYTFIGKAVAADAQNWVFTAITPSFYKGGVSWLDTDAGPAAAETKVVFPNGSSHLTLTVVVPTGGTSIYFVCDGTNWIVNGVVASTTTPAFS